MIIRKNEIKSFIENPGNFKMVLLYGPDNGVAKGYAKEILKNVVDDINDNFAVTKILNSSLISKPIALAEEASQVPMFGGRRCISVIDGNDKSFKAIDLYLENNIKKAFVIVIADSLGINSKLRKLCEKNQNAAVIGCYNDTPQLISNIVSSKILDNNMKIDRDALSLLVSSLGIDRNVTLNEIEKILLYKNFQGNITIEDVKNCLSDTNKHALEDLVYMAYLGEKEFCSKEFEKTLEKGINAISIVRAFLNHSVKIYNSLFLLGEKSAEEIARDRKLGVFWTKQNSFAQHLRLWNIRKIEKAIDILYKLENDVKESSKLINVLCLRGILQITFLARK